MNILLIGECYSANLGDGVICDTVAHLIRDKYDGAMVTYFDLSGRRSYNEYAEPRLKSRRFKWFCRCLYRFPQLIEWHPFVKAYKKDDWRYIRVIANLKETLGKKYDVAIFAGGSLFMDYFAGILFYVVRELDRRKIPIIFHACGMSGLNENSICLLKKTLSHKYVKSISLRDSEDDFERYFPKIKYCSTYDTAFNCCKYFKKSNRSEANIGIGVIARDEYYNFQKQFIGYLLKSDFSWKLFTNGSLGDYETAVNILHELGVGDNNISMYLSKCPATPSELVQTITGFNKIISFRMHSQIIASSFDIESYGFIWDKKIMYMYNKLGFSDYCSVPEEITSIDDILFMRDMNKDELHNNVMYLAKHSKEDLYMQINNVINGEKKS